MSDINNAAASIEKFHFIKDSKLPTLHAKPLNFPNAKISEIEEKENDDEPINN